MIKKLFFCEACRRQLQDVTEIHFVEDHSDRGFCSEKCILAFYRPYMQLLEDEEENKRTRLNLPQEEGHNEILANDHYLQLTLNSPSEIWQVENDLNQKFYTHILEMSIDGEDYFMILICSYIDGAPSFVFYRTLSTHQELINEYRRDKKMEQAEITEELDSEQIDEESNLEVPNDFIELIELKKSTLLAKMLEDRKDSDIGLEEFIAYDDYLEKTLKNPDEIYELEDDEGDTMQTCIKSYRKGDLSFFYILITMTYKQDLERGVMVPILGFPSTDKDLYPKYAVGKRINDTLKN